MTRVIKGEGANHEKIGIVLSATEVFSTIQVGNRRLAGVLHDAGSNTDVVLFAHGFRGEKTGPHRSFVSAARALAARGISSLRIDQYGSGDSEGEFIDSRFDDWVETLITLAVDYRDQGRRVAMFGQSMGGSAVICAAAEVPVSAVVSWVPDASIDAFVPGGEDFAEEDGQRVSNAFWTQAHRADIVGDMAHVSTPCYLVFGTADEYVSKENRQALINATSTADKIDVFDGYPHSAWTFDQTADIIARSVSFLIKQLSPRPG